MSPRLARELHKAVSLIFPTRTGSSKHVLDCVCTLLLWHYFTCAEELRAEFDVPLAARYAPGRLPHAHDPEVEVYVARRVARKLNRVRYE